jgi:hypothetical protein
MAGLDLAHPMLGEIISCVALLPPVTCLTTADISGS